MIRHFDSVTIRYTLGLIFFAILTGFNILKNNPDADRWRKIVFTCSLLLMLSAVISFMLFQDTFPVFAISFYLISRSALMQPCFYLGELDLVLWQHKSHSYF